VNCTDCPAAGEAGLYVNDDIRTDMFATVTIWLPCLFPELARAVNETT